MKPCNFHDFKVTGFNTFFPPSRCVCLSLSLTLPYQQALALKNRSINETTHLLAGQLSPTVVLQSFRHFVHVAPSDLDVFL